MAGKDMLVIVYGDQQFELGAKPFDVDRIREVLRAIPIEAYKKTFTAVVAEIMLTSGRLGALGAERGISEDEQGVLMQARSELSRIAYWLGSPGELGRVDEHGFPLFWER